MSDNPENVENVAVQFQVRLLCKLFLYVLVLILKRFSEQRSKLLSPLHILLSQVRRKLQHPFLRQCALNKPINVLCFESKILQTSGLVAQANKELGKRLAEDLSRALPLDLADVDSESLSGSQVALWVAGSRELEDCRCSDGDADAVGNDLGVGDIARVLVVDVLAGDRVAHAVAEMDTRVAEADSGEGGGEKHLRLGLEVVGVLDGTGQVLDRVSERLQGEDVGYGVCYKCVRNKFTESTPVIYVPPWYAGLRIGLAGLGVRSL